MSDQGTHRAASGPFTVLADSWFTAAIGVVAICFALGALGYSGDAKKFPLVVGILTFVLSVIELILIRRDGALPSAPEAVEESPERRNRQLLLAGWFVLTVAGLYTLGLLVAAFVSTAVYFFVFVDRKPLRAIAFGGAHAAFLWLVFDVFAGFRLYEGSVW